MREMVEHYKLDGKTVILCKSVEEWATWFETADRRVALDVIGETAVSTDFLGLDYGAGFERNDPLLFETLVFLPLGEFGMMNRYFTWAEAEAGHAEIVDMVRQMVDSTDSHTMETLRNLMKGR